MNPYGDWTAESIYVTALPSEDAAIAAVKDLGVELGVPVTVITRDDSGKILTSSVYITSPDAASKSMQRFAAELAARIGMAVDLEEPVGSLGDPEEEE